MRMSAFFFLAGESVWISIRSLPNCRPLGRFWYPRHPWCWNTKQFLSNWRTNYWYAQYFLQLICRCWHVVVNFYASGHFSSAPLLTLIGLEEWNGFGHFHETTHFKNFYRITSKLIKSQSFISYHQFIILIHNRVLNKTWLGPLQIQKPMIH